MYFSSLGNAIQTSPILGNEILKLLERERVFCPVNLSGDRSERYSNERELPFLRITRVNAWL
jgi:hypothetical protein